MMWKIILTCCVATSLPTLGYTDISDDFQVIDPNIWSIAHYDFSHPGFDTDWRSKNIETQNGLKITLEPSPDHATRFHSGSIRTKTKTGFGRYSALIQPAKGDGLVTGFFTYTGPYYGTQHDEIDTEFLGKDTSKLHIAWFVDGQRTERDIPLGFDAADAAHLYEFEWTETSITWFVDGKPLFQTTSADGPIPQTPGRAFANLWVVSDDLRNWAGQADPNLTAHAMFPYFRYVSLPELRATTVTDEQS